jgi:hypothetical protein
MSRIRHEMKKRKAKGGAVVYSGAGSNVVEEAAEKRRGGPVKEVDRPEGRKTKPRMDKRPRRAAGKVTGPAADREMARMEMEAERPRKFSGGSVGADRSPFSSAANNDVRSGVRASPDRGDPTPRERAQLRKDAMPVTGGRGRSER